MYKQIKEEDQQQIPVQNNSSTCNNVDDHANNSSSSTKGSGKFTQLFEKFTFNNNNKQFYRINVELDSAGIHMRQETAQTTGKTTNNKQMTNDKNLDIIREHVLKYADIVGVRCSNQLLSAVDGRIGGKGENVLNVCRHQSVAAKSNDGDITAYLYICAYVKQMQPLQYVRVEHVFHINNASTKDLNMRTAQLWEQAIMHNKSINYKYNALLPLLILLNPKSGAGKARELFQNHMLPVLCDANIPYELQITTRANYAREMLRMRSNILQEYRGIVVASGDGLFYEVLNGIMARPDWKKCMRLPLGIVPCGSGNGLASSIAHFYDEPSGPKAAFLWCISGETTPMDVVRVEMQNEEVIYSFLSLGWGIIADVDIESETLRSIGALRFTLWTIHRMIRLRTYKGRISYLPYRHQTPTNNTTNNMNYDDSRSLLYNEASEHIPPLSVSLKYSDNGWQSEVNDFVLVHAVYTTHLSADAYFLPQSRLNDGIIYLVLIRAGIGRKELLNIFLRLNTGTHFSQEQEHISVIPVTAFRLEPLCNEGIIAVDGERVPYGSIQAEILPGVINVMVPNSTPEPPKS